MRNLTEQWTVEQTVATIANANDVLYTRNIDMTARYTLANSAAAASVAPDELMAVLEYRLRHAAQHHMIVEQVEEADLAEVA